MRYSYGIMDQRKILLYKPQLFLEERDLLVFPSADFQKWHGDIKEYLDALYQIDFQEMGKGKPVSVSELNLALGVANNITVELKNLFNSENVSDLSYHYISTLEEEYKKRRSSYTSDMRRCDLQIPVINQDLKYQHLMEIVEEANREFTHALQEKRMKKKG